MGSKKEVQNGVQKRGKSRHFSTKKGPKIGQKFCETVPYMGVPKGVWDRPIRQGPENIYIPFLGVGSVSFGFGKLGPN